jgi:hypothetical protein
MQVFLKRAALRSVSFSEIIKIRTPIFDTRTPGLPLGAHCSLRPTTHLF